MPVDASLEESRLLAALAAPADDLKHAIVSAPRWVHLGHVLKDFGALDAAETAYRAAIRCDGTEADPKLHLAHLLKQRDRLPQALAVFEDLQAIPDGPNVAQEIAGLRVALLPENSAIQRPATPMPVAPPQPRLDALLSDLSGALARAGIDLTSEEVAPPPSALPPQSRATSCSTDLKAELVPSANLVIRDGVFVGTTDDPRFDIRCGTPCAPGWIEIEFGIEMATPIIEPILYVQHAPHWQAFSTVRLAPRNGRFHAVCRIDGPVLNLRLDPSNAAGSFSVTRFRLKQISLALVVWQAWKRDRALARRALPLRRDANRSAMETVLSEGLSNPALDPYQRWIRRYEAPERLPADTARRNVERWPKKPRLAVLISGDVGSASLLQDTLTALAAQSYPHWTLDIVGATAPEALAREAVETVLPGTAFHKNLVGAVDSRPGGHIVHVAAGDRLAVNALFRLAGEIFARRGTGTDVIYTDEDRLEDGQRCDPSFKPDWDPDFQVSTGYIGHLVAVRQERLSETLSQSGLTAPSWDEALAAVLARVAETDVLHIAEVLNHCHHAPAPVEAPTLIPHSPPREPAAGWPHVTLMIPTRDGVDILRSGIASLLDETDYPDFDILIIDNGSTQPETLRYFEEISAGGRVGILPAPGPFNFSRLNNLGAAAARGSVLGLVNNDVLAVEPQWLKAMVAEAVRPEIGAVGAKLVYPSGHIQHAGMACGVGFVTAHPQKFRDAPDRGYLDSLVATRRVSAVTAACLIVERRKYDEVGGLDEEALQVAFNDVDFCLKLDAAGYRNLFTPAARLVHLESATRGLDMTGEKAARFKREAETVVARWKRRITVDPFYNINLTHEREDNTIRD